METKTLNSEIIEPTNIGFFERSAIKLSESTLNIKESLSAAFKPTLLKVGSVAVAATLVLQPYSPDAAETADIDLTETTYPLAATVDEVYATPSPLHDSWSSIDRINTPVNGDIVGDVDGRSIIACSAGTFEEFSSVELSSDMNPAEAALRLNDALCDTNGKVNITAVASQLAALRAMLDGVDMSNVDNFTDNQTNEANQLLNEMRNDPEQAPVYLAELLDIFSDSTDAVSVDDISGRSDLSVYESRWNEGDIHAVNIAANKGGTFAVTFTISTIDKDGNVVTQEFTIKKCEQITIVTEKPRKPEPVVYTGSVCVGLDADGGKIIHNVSGGTQAEVNAEIARLAGDCTPVIVFTADICTGLNADGTKIIEQAIGSTLEEAQANAEKIAGDCTPEEKPEEYTVCVGLNPNTGDKIYATFPTQAEADNSEEPCLPKIDNNGTGGNGSIGAEAEAGVPEENGLENHGDITDPDTQDVDSQGSDEDKPPEVFDTPVAESTPSDIQTNEEDEASQDAAVPGPDTEIEIDTEAELVPAADAASAMASIDAGFQPDLSILSLDEHIELVNLITERHIGGQSV